MTALSDPQVSAQDLPIYEMMVLSDLRSTLLPN